MTTPPPTLRDLAVHVSKADAALVAAVSGRGIDGHGYPLPDLDANIRHALLAIEEAGRIAAELRREGIR